MGGSGCPGMPWQVVVVLLPPHWICVSVRLLLCELQDLGQRGVPPAPAGGSRAVRGAGSCGEAAGGSHAGGARPGQGSASAHAQPPSKAHQRHGQVSVEPTG
jgi:hypothetical protein